MLLVTLSREAPTSMDRRMHQVQRRSGVVLVDRTGRRDRRHRRAMSAQAGNAWHAGDSRRSGPARRAAFDEAAGGHGPWRSLSRWGVKSHEPEAGERDRERQRQGHDLHSRPITPGSRERRSEGSRSRAPGPSGLRSPGNQGQSRHHAEARGSPSSEARLDHAPVKASAGRAAWKLRSPAKAGDGVIRGLADPSGARVGSRLQTSGRRIFPGRRGGSRGARSRPGSA